MRKPELIPELLQLGAYCVTRAGDIITGTKSHEIAKGKTLLVWKLKV